MEKILTLNETLAVAARAKVRLRTLHLTTPWKSVVLRSSEIFVEILEGFKSINIKERREKWQGQQY